jgi:hypothetical protein
VALNCAIAVAVGATIAVAADGGGQEGRSEAGARLGFLAKGGGPPFAQRLSALAKELGVSTGELRRALREVRDSVDPPEEPSREGFQRHCTALTDALAKELGKDGDDVRAAIKATFRASIEQAVDAGRLSEERAKRILDRIESAECLPPPLIGAFVHGCVERAGRPGERHRGGVMRAPRPPDGESGFELPVPPPVAM